jgi:hypothetical protein
MKLRRDVSVVAAPFAPQNKGKNNQRVNERRNEQSGADKNVPVAAKVHALDRRGM